MNARSSSAVLRLRRASAKLKDLGLDAFVVSHLPNIRYLTGLSASAGLLVITPSRATLIVDFRYRTSARSLLDANPDLAECLSLLVPPQSYDDSLVSLLREIGARRIGIEAASM